MNKILVIVALVAVAASAIGGVVWWASNTQHRVEVAEDRADDAEDAAVGADAQAGLNQSIAERSGDLALRDFTIIQEVHRVQERIRVAVTPDGGVGAAVDAWAVGIDGLRLDAGGAGIRRFESYDPGSGDGALPEDREAGDAGAGHARRGAFDARRRRVDRRPRRGVSRALGGLPGARRLDRRAVPILGRAGGRRLAV